MATPGSAGSGNTPLRDWASKNYSPVNGRSVSSLQENGNTGNMAVGASKQMPTMPKNSLPTNNSGGSGDGSRNARRGSSIP